jgi:hypothetical protein
MSNELTVALHGFEQVQQWLAGRRVTMPASTLC